MDSAAYSRRIISSREKVRAASIVSTPKIILLRPIGKAASIPIPGTGIFDAVLVCTA
jgi:hypothetical protein